ncbi:MAG: hypothetical protein JOY56_01280 [Solirubrobacterales bacterium]|nr:hypothetical protein [Solirubrobacterales bacterium]
MASQTLTALISAAAGLAVATIGAIVKGALAQRADLDEALRDVRTKLYAVAWRATGAISLWPRSDLTWGGLRALQQDLRDWYFADARPLGSASDSPGGLYLSSSSQLRYREMQRLIGLSLKAAKNDHDLVPDDVYDDLRDECSAFRTALTEDLETRRKRSFWWAIRIRWRHHIQERAAEARARSAEARAAEESQAS